MIILNILSNKWDDEVIIKYTKNTILTVDSIETYKLERYVPKSNEKYLWGTLFTMITNKER